MALIKCPECGNDVSDVAKACPKCGFPIAAEDNASTDEMAVKEPFPILPTVMNIGQLITKGLDTTVQGMYLGEINATKYLNDGKCIVAAHTNGICLTTGFKTLYISHEQIVNMKFIAQEQFTTEKKSVIGRAIVGGVLLGPLAAVVGGMSGIGTKTKKLGDFLLVINFWDVFTRQIQSILICTKSESVQFIKRVQKEKESHNTPTGSFFICNILDERKEISEDKLIEALKVVGEETLAKTISIIDGSGDMTAINKLREIGKKQEVDTSEFKSSGCMLAFLVQIAGMVSFLSLLILIL